MKITTASAKGKHIPQRMCVVCRERKPKSQLSRYIRDGKGDHPISDPDQKLPGRGMYVCDREECRKRFEWISLRK